jgi:drug/metabolite transporter (DMT)-like permease
MSKYPAGIAHAGLKGVVLMIAATAFFASADTIAKQLAGSIPPVQIAWLRYFVFVLILVPIVIGRYGASALRSANPKLQIVRGLGMLGSALLFMTGLAFLPVADATAIFFISPIAITALAVIFLGERVGWRRWLAAFVGLAGVLIIIRPGASAFQAAALLPFLAAFAWATASTITRRMSGSDLPITTLVYSALVGIVTLSAMVPFWWITPSAPQLWLALAMGILSTAGHGLVVLAFREADASIIAPYAYGQIIWAGALGFIAFGAVPDGYTVLGALVIAASGIYISYRERRRASA